MRRLAALLVLALVGYPLAILPSKAVAVIASAALALCVLGIAARFTPVLTAGVALALGEYTLALSLSAGPPRLAGAVGVAVVVALLLEVSDFDRRFRHVAIGRFVIASQLRYWAVFGALGGTAALVLVGAASALNSVVRLPYAPLLAAAGALAALGAAAVVLRRACGTGVDATS